MKRIFNKRNGNYWEKYCWGNLKSGFFLFTIA